eukprot:CAMPEP_0198123720 /NCGR_PEP_ID=MMETSP1442-20131203/38200_1 /TAXON_ID= /ORGANISM="Craspedostauros australis, Strain CCMP3328" /LENGTH=48 /DNA_ID= /DNA_START= /DNA_END= /DNA_ORIENTATION=
MQHASTSTIVYLVLLTKKRQQGGCKHTWEDSLWQCWLVVRMSNTNDEG